MVKTPRSRDTSNYDSQDLSVYCSTPILCNSIIYSEPLRHMPSLKFVFCLIIYEGLWDILHQVEFTESCSSINDDK